MKIRKLTPENYPKVSALLKQAFPRSSYEFRLIERLHKNDKPVIEWVCIHINRVIAYIAFTNAYKGTEICGLHLAPLAVKPDFQKQGIASELMRFALRQEIIKTKTIYVLGATGFYQKFGFKPCLNPICPFDKNNANFFSLGDQQTDKFTVGYEPEFFIGA